MNDVINSFSLPSKEEILRARIRELEDAVKRIDAIKRTAEKGWREELVKNEPYCKALVAIKTKSDAQYNLKKSAFAKLISVIATEALKEGK